jgi:hypothetical protein
MQATSAAAVMAIFKTEIASILLLSPIFKTARSMPMMDRG